eukprot:Tbor_TRINITY_DN3298_c0_g1::TRINITY_DN3298_c0_g1_i1::g.23694::m.23694
MELLDKPLSEIIKTDSSVKILKERGGRGGRGSRGRGGIQGRGMARGRGAIRGRGNSGFSRFRQDSRSTNDRDQRRERRQVRREGNVNGGFIQNFRRQRDNYRQQGVKTFAPFRRNDTFDRMDRMRGNNRRAALESARSGVRRVNNFGRGRGGMRFSFHAADAGSSLGRRFGRK